MRKLLSVLCPGVAGRPACRSWGVDPVARETVPGLRLLSGRFAAGAPLACIARSLTTYFLSLLF